MADHELDLSLDSLGNKLDRSAGGHFPAPAWDVRGVCFTSVPPELKQGQGQIAESCHDMGCAFASYQRAVFTEGDIASVMGIDFTGRPVISDETGKGLGIVFVNGQTAGIEGVLLGRFDDFAITELLTIPPNRDELPATAQPGFLRSHRNPLQAPPFESTVSFAPAGVVFRGKKNVQEASLELAPESRFGCL